MKMRVGLRRVEVSMGWNVWVPFKEEYCTYLACLLLQDGPLLLHYRKKMEL